MVKIGVPIAPYSGPFRENSSIEAFCPSCFGQYQQRNEIDIVPNRQSASVTMFENASLHFALCCITSGGDRQSWSPISGLQWR